MKDYAPIYRAKEGRRHTDTDRGGWMFFCGAMWMLTILVIVGGIA